MKKLKSIFLVTFYVKPKHKKTKIYFITSKVKRMVATPILAKYISLSISMKFTSHFL